MILHYNPRLLQDAPSELRSKERMILHYQRSQYPIMRSTERSSAGAGTVGEFGSAESCAPGLIPKRDRHASTGTSDFLDNLYW